MSAEQKIPRRNLYIVLGVNSECVIHMNVYESCIDLLDMKGKPIFDGEIKKIRLSGELLIIETNSSLVISTLPAFCS